jgi:hypothetical protein
MGTILVIGAAGISSVVISKIIEAQGKNPHNFEVSFGAGVGVLAIYKVTELIQHVATTFIY